MTSRITKKRTLQKAGFVHVAGWLKADRAAEVQAEIEAEKGEVEELTRDEVTK
jgi:hypothetical protein